jgi:small subunit ribosomal protein S6
VPYYEYVFIARQDISPQQVDALVEDCTRIVGELGGKVGKSEYWGLRNLAYRVRKNRKGHYCLLNLDAPAPAVHELERRMRINEDVLRHMTVRVEALDEEPSPVLARRDRDEKRRARRDAPRDGEGEGGYEDGGRDRDRDRDDRRAED